MLPLTRPLCRQFSNCGVERGGFLLERHDFFRLNVGPAPATITTAAPLAQHSSPGAGRRCSNTVRPAKRESWSYLLQKPCSNRPAPEWDRLPDESGEVSDKGGVALSARKAVSMVTNETDLRSMSAFGSARATVCCPPIPLSACSFTLIFFEVSHIMID